MKKTLTKIVTLLLTLSLLVGTVSTTVFASSSDSKSGTEAPKETIEGGLTTGWCDISYDENGITVLLTPSMEELAGINREELESVLGMLIEAVKESVVFDLKDELLGSDSSEPETPNTELTSAEKVFEKALDAYVADTYGKATSENYVNFLKDLVGADANTAIDAFAAYVCDLLTTVVASGAIEIENLPEAEDIEDNIVTIFESELNKRIAEEAERLIALYIANLKDSSVEIDEDIKALIDGYVEDFVNTEVNEYINNGFKPQDADNDVDRIVATYIDKKIHHEVDAWLRAYAANESVPADVLVLIEAEITKWAEEVADAYVSNSVPENNPIYADVSGKLDAIVDAELLAMIEAYLGGETINASIAAAIESTLDAEAPGYIYDLYWEHKAAATLTGEFWVDVDSQIKSGAVLIIMALKSITQTDAENYFNTSDVAALKAELEAEGFAAEAKSAIADTVAGYTVADWDKVWDNLTEDEHDAVVDIVVATDAFKAILEDVLADYWLGDDEDSKKNRRDAIAYVIASENYETVLATVINDAETKSEYVDIIKNKVNSYLDDAITLLEGTVSELSDTDYEALSAAIDAICDAELENIKDEAFVVALGKNETEVKSAIINVAIPRFLVKYTETVEGFEVEVPEFEIKDIIKLIKDISVGEHALFVDGAFDVEAIKNFIFDLPTLEDIADMSNKEMQLSYNVSVATDVGVSTFDISIVLTDGYNVVRKYAGLIAKYLDFDMNEEGVIVFDLEVSDGFAKLVLKAANSDKVPDEIKKKVFSMFTTTPGDVHAFINESTFEDVLALLDYVDFEGLMDVEFLSSFEQLDGLTAEQVKAKLREYENYFNKFVKLVNKIYGKLPEGLKNKNVMDIYDGNGSFIHSAEYSVDIEKLIEGFSPKYAALIASFMTDSTVNAAVDVSVTFDKINSVEFVIEGETHKKGLLPEGADLLYFADITKFGHYPVVCWKDAEGNTYTEMPDCDITLYAELNKTFGLTAAIQSAIEKVYDGETSELRVVLDYESLPSNLTPSYQWYKNGEAIQGAILSGITVKNVADSGSYYCVVTLYEDGDPVAYISSNECTVAISKADLDLTLYSWQPTELVYSGEAQSVFLKDAEGNVLELGVTYLNDGTYTNTATLAGSYVASVVIDTDNLNVNGTVENYEWQIKKATVDLSKYNWKPTNIVYDGEVHTVTLVDSEGNALTDGIRYVVDENYTNQAVNAGKYVAKIELVDSDNYEFLGNKDEYNWEIKKASYDMSSVKFLDKTVVFNGEAHSLEITGTLPEGVTESYSAGGFVNPGTYSVTVSFEISNENYNEIPNMTATLRILGFVKNHTVKDSAGTVVLDVEALSGILELYSINMKDISSQYYYLSSDDIFGEGKVGYVGAAYDIYFAQDGVNQPVNDSFTVKLLIPAHLRDIADDVMKVVYVNENGKLQDMKGTRQGDYVVFNTTHFSVYAITETADAPIPPTVPDYTWIWILVAVLLVLIIVAVIVFIIIKKRKGNDDGEPQAPADKPVDESPTEEIPTEEAPVEEAPVEEAPVEEAPVEEALVEEAPAEEAPAEEAPAEEAPAEEAPAEEAPAEEAPAEEAPAEEAPAEEAPVEEAPAEEAPAEETPAEEAPAEETPAEEAPVEKPKPIPVIIPAGDDDAAGQKIINGEAVQVRYRTSFMSRLIQAEAPLQDYYSVVKNELLSYKGVKARTSWNFESFNKGRIQCAKLNIKGNAFQVYLGLEPKEYNANKYHFVDVSDKPKLDKVPMLLKVKSERSLKYVLELIEEMMNKLGIEKGETPEVDYHLPYETTDALAARDLVKVILPAGVKLDGDEYFVKIDVGALIDEASADKAEDEVIEAPAEEAPAEETPVEEAPVEEAPAEETPVEEAPVEEAPVEEAPVEEAPVEEAPVEEAPAEPVHVDAIEADAMVSDAEAEAKIELVEKTGTFKSQSKKFCEINLDTICENFEDGDTVTLAILQDKCLAPKSAGRLKVLARGVMTKKLAVYADKFSIQAVKMITLAGGTIGQYKN